MLLNFKYTCRSTNIKMSAQQTIKVDRLNLVPYMGI